MKACNIVILFLVMGALNVQAAELSDELTKNVQLNASLIDSILRGKLTLQDTDVRFPDCETTYEHSLSLVEVSERLEKVFNLQTLLSRDAKTPQEEETNFKLLCETKLLPSYIGFDSKRAGEKYLPETIAPHVHFLKAVLNDDNRLLLLSAELLNFFNAEDEGLPEQEKKTILQYRQDYKDALLRQQGVSIQKLQEKLREKCPVEQDFRTRYLSRKLAVIADITLRISLSANQERKKLEGEGDVNELCAQQ